MDPWFRVKSEAELHTPSLLVYPERIQWNIDEMIRLAGSVDRLRPHVKTHKCPDIVNMQLNAGIARYKCATIAEAEMLAGCGVEDVLIAYQLTGGNLNRFFRLQKNYPQVRFTFIIDDLELLEEINDKAIKNRSNVRLFIDLDVGMHRTGVSSAEAIAKIYQQIDQSSNLTFGGWHIYDGHIRDYDFKERKAKADGVYTWVVNLIEDYHPAEIVIGGSPTFPVHAARDKVFLSPGTVLLWDHGYRRQLPDLQFKPAALLATRVISKPAGDLLCLDLGHKAVASEMLPPRIHLLGLEVLEFIIHSEEHLVLRTPEAPRYQVGDLLYGIPMHICPTVALHEKLLVVQNREITREWPVLARSRQLTV